MVRAGIKRALKIVVLCALAATLIVVLKGHGHSLTFFKFSSKPPVSDGRLATGKHVEKILTTVQQQNEDEECEMCEQPFVFRDELKSDPPLTRKMGDESSVPAFRRYARHEPWPEIQPHYTRPGQVPPTVHYVWCDSHAFGFHHYLGVLSILRLLQPLKLVFHYLHTPPLDKLMYNTWFLELKQSVPNLVVRSIEGLIPLPCGSSLNSLRAILSFLQKDGGVYVSPNVILTRMPRDLNAHALWGTAAKGTSGGVDLNYAIFASSKGFNDSFKEAFITRLPSGATPTCALPTSFDPRPAGSSEAIQCVYVADSPPVFPKNIMHANSSFAELARWLYYGKRAPMWPKRIANSIPRISHFVWFNRNEQSSTELQFYQYVTVLSALYVAGLEHVYVHGNKEFTGPWWEKLKQENVTFVPVEIPETVFQQKVENIEHKSDITRYYILHKYGGVYSDFEAMWTQRIPDWLLSYPTVANSDWVQNGQWPDNINNGVLLARPGSPWLRHMLEAQRYYVDSQFVFNSILMSYRTYERHPDQLLMYRHLQVMCYNRLCHPTWHEGFMRSIQDRRQTPPFDWRTETLVVHVTGPEPETSLTSPETLKKGTDVFADIGRFILKKSNREDIFK